jgi:hypothetical protein
MTDRQNAKHLRSEVLKGDDMTKGEEKQRKGSRVNTESKSDIQCGQRIRFQLPTWKDRRTKGNILISYKSIRCVYIY